MLNKGDFISDTDLKAQFGKISDTARTANMAEAYAYDAIEFALDAIEEAEYAAVYAIYARADAEALKA